MLDAVPLPVGVGVSEAVLDAVPLPVGVPVLEGVPEGVGLLVGDGVSLPLALGATAKLETNLNPLTLRIRLFMKSVIYNMVPLGSRASPYGVFSCAVRHPPSRNPAVPSPTMVITSEVFG